MTASGTPLHFLIIDDNVLLNRSLKNYFEAQGHQCTCLLESTLAIEWLEGNSCDAVLSDIRMPEIDGLALTKLIREKLPSLPILITTSLGYDEELMQTALKAGADGYISKVMGPKALLMTLVQTAARRTSPAARIAA
jgi:DNA-binding response OmpR family regulator